MGAVSDLLKPIQQVEWRARIHEEWQGIHFLSLLLASKYLLRGDILEQRYSITDFRKDLRVTSSSVCCSMIAAIVTHQRGRGNSKILAKIGNRVPLF